MLGLLAYTSWHRLYYPYDLEWMEGGMLIHAQRIMEGKGLYVEPSSDFIPYIYPPLYSWLLAFGASLTELDYWVGRSLSIFGTLLAGGAIIRALRWEKFSWGYSILGAGLFFSCYEDGGTFFDLTRADALLIAAIGWALVFVREGKVRIGGLVLVLAFLLKHNAAMFGIPCLWWLWKEKGRKEALEFALFSTIPALLMTGYLQWSSDGYFLTYLLGVPSGHPIVGYRLVWLSFQELFSAFSGITILGLVWIFQRLFQERKWFAMSAWAIALAMAGAILYLPESSFPEIAGSHQNGIIPFAVLMWTLVIGSVGHLCWKSSPKYSFWLLNGLVALGFSALMRGHHGGFTNVLIPGFWCVSIWGILVLERFAKYPTLVVIVSALSLWLGKWEASDFIPTQADRDAGDLIVSILKEADGPIFVPHSPWLAVQAGHSPTAHLIAIWDIDHKGGPLESSMKRIRKDISTHRWGTICSADRKLGFGIKKYYRASKTIRPKERDFMPKIGWKVRPSYLLQPKKRLQ
jgi:hypothetical protein